MFCNQCGEENRNDRKFCASCGAPLKEYTKPRENLIMPEDIKEKQTAVSKKNKTIKILNLCFCWLFILGAIFTFVSFFVRAKLAFIICAVVLLISSITLLIVSKSIKAHYNKVINK